MKAVAGVRTHRVVIRPFDELVDPLLRDWRVAFAKALGAIDDGKALLMFGAAANGRIVVVEIHVEPSESRSGGVLCFVISLDVCVGDSHIARGSFDLRVQPARLQRKVSEIDLHGELRWLIGPLVRRRSLGKARHTLRQIVDGYFEQLIGVLSESDKATS